MSSILRNCQSRKVCFFLFSVSLILISACRPRPSLPLVVITPSPTKTRVQPTLNPTIAQLITSEAIAQVTPTEASIPTTPTPTPCVPPDGWLPYQVQAGDTLFSLAQLTGTEVESLTVANCLSHDFLAIEQTLFLPRLPPPPPPVVVAFAPEIPNSECPSLLSCPVNPQVGTYVRQPLSPGEEPPCTNGEADKPYIDATGYGDASIGKRTYFFACNFNNPQTWQVTLTDDNEQEVQLNPDRDFNPLLTQQRQSIVNAGNAQLIFVWSVSCNVPEGGYRLTIQANNEAGNAASFEGVVKRLSNPQILVAPQVNTPGNSFDVYFCGFPKDIPIIVSVNYGLEFVDGGQKFYPAKEISVHTNNQGNGSLTIGTRSDDEKRNYELSYKGVFDTFVLTEGGPDDSKR